MAPPVGLCVVLVPPAGQTVVQAPQAGQPAAVVPAPAASQPVAPAPSAGLSVVLAPPAKLPVVLAPPAGQPVNPIPQARLTVVLPLKDKSRIWQNLLYCWIQFIVILGNYLFNFSNLFAFTKINCLKTQLHFHVKGMVQAWVGHFVTPITLP